MTDRDDTAPEALDLLLDAARRDAAAPAPAALTARVLADAERLRPRAPRPRVAARPARSRPGAVLAALGGWPALGGLVAAGVAGLWLGLAPPAAVEAGGGWLALGSDEGDLALLLPDYGLSDLDEG